MSRKTFTTIKKKPRIISFDSVKRWKVIKMLF